MPATITLKETYSPTKAKRVLLLEDDTMLQGAIRDFLEENFYQVVAVTNGADGVRAVLKQEFDVIICDMMMPKLPGNMFYAAVERTHPHLCKRFIFITGHRGNTAITDFINQVKGTMLAKPFHMDSLLDAVALIQVNDTFKHRR
jgi:DNA-binding response OmpR family regulator